MDEELKRRTLLHMLDGQQLLVRGLSQLLSQGVWLEAAAEWDRITRSLRSELDDVLIHDDDRWEEYP